MKNNCFYGYSDGFRAVILHTFGVWVTQALGFRLEGGAARSHTALFTLIQP